MELLILLLSLVAPDLSRLGADSFAVREAETARCDNFVLALLLPASHPDPEVNCRIRELRGRNLKWLRLEHVERYVYGTNYERWLDLWFLRGTHHISDADVLCDLRSSYILRDALSRRWPHRESDWWVSDMSEGNFKDYCDYYRGVAPIPHEK